MLDDIKERKESMPELFDWIEALRRLKNGRRVTFETWGSQSDWLKEVTPEEKGICTENFIYRNDKDGKIYPYVPTWREQNEALWIEI